MVSCRRLKSPLERQLMLEVKPSCPHCLHRCKVDFFLFVPHHVEIQSPRTFFSVPRDTAVTPEPIPAISYAFGGWRRDLIILKINRAGPWYTVHLKNYIVRRDMIHAAMLPMNHAMNHVSIIMFLKRRSGP